MEMKMILDDKGRIFGRMNIVDIAIVAIMILSLFIALKLIFFPVNYFQYDYLDAEINYSYIPKQNLSMFSIGRNSIYDDNDSYMVVPEGKQVDCYIDIFTQKIMDPISNESGWITLIKRHDICYFTKSSPYSGFNEDRLNEAMEKSNVVCEENVEDLDYSEFIIPGNSTYLCKALFLFK